MIKAGLGETVVVAKIRASTTDFDVSSAELVRLKGQGVPDEVLAAMVEATDAAAANATVGVLSCEEVPRFRLTERVETHKVVADGGPRAAGSTEEAPTPTGTAARRRDQRGGRTEDTEVHDDGD